jgi:flagellar hook-associated protein 3 FlgL
MRITNQMITNGAIQHMADSLERLHTLQDKVSTGKNFLASSDDPVGASMSLSLRSGLRAIESYQNTSAIVKDWMSASDFAFGHADDAATRAMSLVTAGLNDTLDGTARGISLGTEMDGLINQVLSLANTQQKGQYIFSGYKVDVQPFDVVYDAAYNDPVSGHYRVNYNGDAGIMQRNVNPGQKIAMNVDGNGAFTGLIKSLIQAREALNANDTTTLRTALGGIQSNADILNQYRTSNGARMRQTDLVVDYLDQAKVEASSLLSKKEDIDMAEGITLLHAQETTYQAVLEVSQRTISTMNLFDYMR